MGAVKRFIELKISQNRCQRDGCYRARRCITRCGRYLRFRARDPLYMARGSLFAVDGGCNRVRAISHARGRGRSCRARCASQRRSLC